MSFEITWTITAIIAVSSFLSPIAVAIINNRHNAKMRKLEIAHDEYIRQLDIYYAEKKATFSELASAAGQLYAGRADYRVFQNAHSALNKAFLFCNENTQKHLLDFLAFVTEKVLESPYSSDIHNEFNGKLSDIMQMLNEELKASKPVTNCK